METTATSHKYGLVHLADQLKLSDGQRHIALIQYAIEVVPEHFIYYSPDDIHWLNQVLSSLIYPNPPVNLAELITPQDAQTYLDFHGRPLFGLHLTHDSGNALIWQECLPTDPQQQITYIQHYLLPHLAQTVIGTIADLTPERAIVMQPDTIRALSTLAHTLVTLDIQNENGTLDFSQRPDPRLELFGDACRDVLHRRIAAALQQLGTP